ncbi:DUF6308 family protein [Crystallibacter degradans]|uniref:DUF6308 family protein n=1 Tax=Crystallibacter degradans TaxID=2726743 RepID=UPI0014747C95|nr:DUF6308 family protein [Arthrobacter sp. SF27]NMR29200.1 hypothetical protein [Arthrobacter sp. SF27]
MKPATLMPALKFKGGTMPYKALFNVSIDHAATYVKHYFSTWDNGRPKFTGSRFETLANGGDLTSPNAVTADDLIAVAMLAVHVPGQAALGILNGLAGELEPLWDQLPTDAKFEDLDGASHTNLLGPDGPGQKIWDTLRQNNGGVPWGVGQTTASKIMARKRPHLIPIYDSVVGKQTGMKNSSGQWNQWFEAFQEKRDGGGLKERLETIRERAGKPHLSLLRVLDIVLWMDGRGPETTKEVVDLSEAGER